MKQFFLVFSLAAALLLVSCSEKDYVNVIPHDSIALMAVDMKNMELPKEVAEASEGQSLSFMAGMLGIDLSVPVYAFETKEGNFGVCAKVEDVDRVKACVNDMLTQQNVCTPLTQRKEFFFSVIKNSWVLGISDEALLIMGPAVPSAQSQLQHQMAQFLEADSDKGVKDSPLFAKLDSLQAPVRLVAQAQALPEQVAAPLTLGAPKDADASQVLIAAEMKTEGHNLMILSHAFSLNEKVNSAIQDNLKALSPIGNQYINEMSDSDVAAVFLNVDGARFLDVIKANKSLQLLLAGVNTAVDMDNIIRSIQGETAFFVKDGRSGDWAMYAQLAKTDFLGDVDYWKQSAPQGMSIQDQGKNAFRVTGGDAKYIFGVTDDKQFYAATNDSLMLAQGKNTHPAPQSLTDKIKGQRMAVVVNLSPLFGEQADMSLSFIQPLFGPVEYVVYTLSPDPQ